MESLSLTRIVSRLEGDPNEVVFGQPKSKYFQQTQLKAIVIVASDYSELRKIEGKEKYKDLPETKQDLENILNGLESLGFAESDTTVLEEPTFIQIHQKFMEISLQQSKDAMAGHQTVFYFYYAGHGLSDNNLYLQLNEKRIYPIEKMLRSLAKSGGCYIIALFDCCREKFLKDSTRGSGEDDVEIGPLNQENFIFTFGCPPSEGVPAKSTIAESYMQYLRSHAQQGYIQLPGNLNYYNGTDTRAFNKKAESCGLI